MENTKFKIASAQSKIEWVGRKVTGSHNGTIDILDGELELNDGKIVGGQFVIDTTSIKILDIADPATNAQFAGHLASDDFFSTQNYPKAHLEIISVNGKHIEGALTIKGITHPVGFDATITVGDGIVTAVAKILVDRTKYGMKFRSGNFFQNLGDTLIYNDFELDIHLSAKVTKKAISVLA
jgi:polyisoprenoid-binding protein YceI